MRLSKRHPVGVWLPCGIPLEDGNTPKLAGSRSHGPTVSLLRGAAKRDDDVRRFRDQYLFTRLEVLGDSLRPQPSVVDGSVPVGDRQILVSHPVQLERPDVDDEGLPLTQHSPSLRHDTPASPTRIQRAELGTQAERVAQILEGVPRLTLGPVTVGPHA
jgi:hypothetical protein